MKNTFKNILFYIMYIIVQNTLIDFAKKLVIHKY